MNRVIFAPKATLSSRQLTLQSNCEQRETQQLRDSAEAMQVRKRLVKVARRLGLVFGVRSRSTAEETLVIRSSMRKSPAAAAGARSASKAKKTVRFEDTATVSVCGAYYFYYDESILPAARRVYEANFSRHSLPIRARKSRDKLRESLHLCPNPT